MAAKVDAADERYWQDVIAPLVAAHPNVEFIGEINEHQKAEFLGNAQALLFPIDWPEPFGLVMIEAMACGTPVVAFDRGSVPEVIDDGVTGFVVGSIAESITALSRIQLLDRRHVRDRFEQRFTAERMAQEYLAAYSRLARIGARKPRLELVSA
jgi:glycosyltransferase involved in cell wall biosynthesis